MRYYSIGSIMVYGQVCMDGDSSFSSIIIDFGFLFPKYSVFILTNGICYIKYIWNNQINTLINTEMDQLLYNWNASRKVSINILKSHRGIEYPLFGRSKCQTSNLHHCHWKLQIAHFEPKLVSPCRHLFFCPYRDTLVNEKVSLCDPIKEKDVG